MQIPLSKLTVVDIIKNHNYDLISDAISKISQSNDRLKDNYVSIDFSKYLSFTVVCDRSDVVAFSGLQVENYWGKKNARALSRYYISPVYRHGVMLMNNDLFAELMFPVQLAIAKEHQFENLFISRENATRAFSKYITRMNLKIEESNFSLPLEKYNVCGNLSTSESCKQFVTKMALTDTADYYWTMSMLKYKLF